MATRGWRALLMLLTVSLVASLTSAAPASERVDLPDWLQEADSASRAVIVGHLDKTPPEFFRRLRHAFPDGTVGVMVRLSERTEATESLAELSTTALNWYGDLPAFYGRVDDRGMASLLASPEVMFVEPDYRITNFLSTAAVDVTARSGQSPTGLWSYYSGDGPYGKLASDIEGFSPDRVTGKNVVVANSDSGIDGTHRDFGGWDCKPGPMQPCESRIIRKVVINQLLPGDNDEAPWPTTDLASGHGTHTAGIIAGNGFYARTGDANPQIYGGDGFNFGIAPQASLISVKVGDSQSAALGFLALQWQAAHAEKYDIRVSNNSWGCSGGCSFDSRSTGALILKNLHEQGVLITFAAGNDGGGPDGAAFNGHAQSPHVLAVAAYDDEQEAPTIADFSSRGSDNAPLPDPEKWTPESEGNGARRPDLSAPGVSVYSAANLTGGTSSLLPRTSPQDVDAGVPFLAYTFMSGTSMATPMVSGAAALLFSACPDTSTLDVMRALMVGAQGRGVRDSDGSTVAAPYVTGYGALDIRASFDWLLQEGFCNGGSASETLTPRIDGPNDTSVGSAVRFDGSKSSVSGGAIESYSWDLGDGTKRSGEKISHVYKKPGTYKVSLTIKGGGGSEATRTTTVYVSPPATFTEKTVVRHGSYFFTGIEFIIGCPRMPVTQGLDGYVFTLPEAVGRRGAVATISVETGVAFGSVFSNECRSSVVAHSEGSRHVRLALVPNTRYVVAMVDARGATDIGVTLKVHDEKDKLKKGKKKRGR